MGIDCCAPLPVPPPPPLPSPPPPLPPLPPPPLPPPLGSLLNPARICQQSSFGVTGLKEARGFVLAVWKVLVYILVVIVAFCRAAINLLWVRRFIVYAIGLYQICRPNRLETWFSLSSLTGFCSEVCERLVFLYGRTAGISAEVKSMSAMVLRSSIC